MAKKLKNKKKNIFFLALALTIIDLIIPDPLPLLDEIVLLLWTSYSSYKYLKK